MQQFKYGLERLDARTLRSNSQAGQDLFVVAMTQGLRQGTFLELGAGHVRSMSNCYMLEHAWGWTGYSIDQDACGPRWLPANDWPAQRPGSQFVHARAELVDYASMPDYFDYVQFDLDSPEITLQVMELLSHKQFALVTFEHDIWRDTEANRELMHLSRQYWQERGYVLVANNVTIPPGRGYGPADRPLFFEDWYAHPKYIQQEVIEAYRWVDDGAQAKYHTDILFNT
jgi:hypothetical protein